MSGDGRCLVVLGIAELVGRGLPVAQVGNAVALVGNVFAQVGNAFPLVGDAFAAGDLGDWHAHHLGRAQGCGKGGNRE